MAFTKTATVITGLLIVVSYAATASAASLSLAPTTSTVPAGNTFSIAITVGSDSPALNALSGTVSFPANLLEVVAISKNQSIISLWVQEPTFSNTAGTIQFEGVVPNPGYTGLSGRVLTVTFKAKAVGNAALSFSAGSVLANDGEGTEILTSRGSASYTIVAVASPALLAPVPSSAPSDASASGALPRVTSTTHLEGVWSRVKDGEFNFEFSRDVMALRLLLDEMPASIPVVTYAPPISSREITDLDEGVSYLHVQYKTAAGWGPVLHYQLLVDTVAPTPFRVTEIAPGQFTFSATDTESGIVRYDVQIDEGEMTTVSPGVTSYAAPVQTPGSHTLVVRAVDAAGNIRTATQLFVIAPVPITPVMTEQLDTRLQDPGSLFESRGMIAIAVLSIVVPLTALVLLLGWLLYLSWRALGGVKRKIESEVAEARTNVHLAFVAMRADFEVDVEMLRKSSTKRKLTREEAKILKHLQQNLDTTETTITKEITDIRESAN